MRQLVIVVLLFGATASEAGAWGEEGHSIVAEVAQRRLSPTAAEAITGILNADPNAHRYTTPSLASISTWADEVRYNERSRTRLITGISSIFRGWTRFYDSATECPKENPEQGDCVINELARLTERTTVHHRRAATQGA